MNAPPPSACPLPAGVDPERIVLAEGEGGRASRRLIRDWILPRLGLSGCSFEDAAVLAALHRPPVVTTDGFVVTPLFFPGGDIGALSIHGTVNDLLVRGADPVAVCLALLLEEGLEKAILERVLLSMRQAAEQAGVQIVAGDTKVVPRGAADRLFVTTTGIGQLRDDAPPGPAALEPGDRLLVSGDIGRHGIAVLCAREGLDFQPPPVSDCAPLLAPIAALRAAGIPPRAMRDATRGGVAAVLHEWAAACRLTLTIDETRLPVAPATRGACELLGLDPLHVANEGTLVAAVRAADAEAARTALRSVAPDCQAEIVGEVRPRGAFAVTIRRALGGERFLDDPAGAPLPRIC